MNDLIQTGFDYAALPVESALNGRVVGERLRTRLKRTVQDIIESGKDLIQIKPSLEGFFDAWFEHETGLDRQMAYKFIQAAERFGNGTYNNYTSFSPTVIYLLSAPSTPDSIVEKALEKAEAGEKVTTEWVKEQKRLEAEIEAEKQRNREWAEQSNKQRKQISELTDLFTQQRNTIHGLENQIDLLEAKTATPEKIEVLPADYETVKTRAAQLEAELVKVKKEQSKLVNDQLKAKLRERQAEWDKVEADMKYMEDIVERKKAYLDSLNSEVKRLEIHDSTINGVRLELISLAAFLSDEEPIQDAETLKRWRALADMLGEAMTAVHQYAGDAKPALTVIAGGAA